MKEIILYQCEICNYTYTNKTEAIRCENRPTPSTIYKVGDKLPIETRYDGIEDDIITDIILVGHDIKGTTKEKHQMSKDDICGTDTFIISDGTDYSFYYSKYRVDIS